MEKILDDIIKKIKARLKEGGMSQQQFSMRMGKGKNWFTALPHVQHDIKVKDLMKACKILGLEPSNLLEGNFKNNICDMTIEDLIKMLVKQECDSYLDEKLGNASNLLEHIRKKDNV